MINGMQKIVIPLFCLALLLSCGKAPAPAVKSNMSSMPAIADARYYDNDRRYADTNGGNPPENSLGPMVTGAAGAEFPVTPGMYLYAMAHLDAVFTWSVPLPIGAQVGVSIKP